MHDHGGRGGPARPPRRRWRPYLVALVAVLALALAVAACGDGVAAALVLGAVAGLYPAIRAARLAPTDALRTT